MHIGLALHLYCVNTTLVLHVYYLCDPEPPGISWGLQGLREASWGLLKLSGGSQGRLRPPGLPGPSWGLLGAA